MSIDLDKIEKRIAQADNLPDLERSEYEQWCIAVVPELVHEIRQLREERDELKGDVSDLSAQLERACEE